MTVASIDALSREELQGKRVLVRIDAEDDMKLRDSLPTLTFLSRSGSRVVIVTHCGSPPVAPRFDYIAARLAQLLGRQVHQLDEWKGEAGLRAVVSNRDLCPLGHAYDRSPCFMGQRESIVAVDVA